MVASRNVCIILVRKREVICICVDDFTFTRSLLDIRNLCLTYYWNFGELSKITSGISFRGAETNLKRMWVYGRCDILCYDLVYQWNDFENLFHIGNASFRISNLNSITLDFLEKERNITRTNYWKPAKICKQPYFRSVDKVSEIIRDKKYFKKTETQKNCLLTLIFSAHLWKWQTTLRTSHSSQVCIFS